MDGRHAMRPGSRLLRFEHYFCLLSCLLVISLFMAITADASVTLKITASNPSELTAQEAVVKSYLPKGIQTDNVINIGALELGYDPRRGQAYVHKKMMLEPRASVTYNVEIDDIWLIDEEALNKLRERVKRSVDELKESDYASVSKGVENGVEEGIGKILERQDDSMTFKVSIIEHISAYEINQEKLALIQQDAEALEKLVIIVKGGSGNGLAPSLQAAGVLQETSSHRLLPLYFGRLEDGDCLMQEEMRNYQERVTFDEVETVTFKLEVENPSLQESQVVPVKYLLAKEVKAGDVLDPGELSVGYDFEKALYYVFKNDVQLRPGEIKAFNIVLKNKWAISKVYLLSLKIYVENMVEGMKDLPVFGKASFLGGNITERISDFLEKKESSEFTEEHVFVFREYKKALEDIKKDVDELKEISRKAGIAPEVSIADKERLCEEAQGSGDRAERQLQEAAKQKETSRTSYSKGLASREMNIFAGTIFRGKHLSTVSTWKIISSIIAFLGLISSVFYFINIRQHKSTMYDTLTGAFTRGYVLERFREELKIAKGGGNTCSLLVMDIDKFKGINDTYGHAAGDIVLKEFVIMVRKGIRATDLVGRFGGDEFMIILPTSKKENAFKIAEGIARIVEGSIIRVTPQMDLSITTSIGVASFPDDSGTVDDLFDKADRALYEVKKRGGNGAEMFNGQA